MKRSCSTCRLSINGMPGKCDSRRCLSGNFSGWRPPLDTTENAPKIILTDEFNGARAVPTTTPVNLCEYCVKGPNCGQSGGCGGKDFEPKPVPKRSEVAPQGYVVAQSDPAQEPELEVTEILIDDPIPHENTPVKAQEFVHKSDMGKTDMSLLAYFPRALEAICKQSEFGCQKYERGSFKDVKNARRRYTAAMLRHFLAEGENEPEIDEETGLEHDIATAWNAVCRLELRLRGYKLDE